MAKRTAQDIRRRNRFDALRCVFAAPGPVSRQEVAAATGLSFATVANLVAELLEAESSARPATRTPRAAARGPASRSTRSAGRWSGSTWRRRPCRSSCSTWH